MSAVERALALIEPEARSEATSGRIEGYLDLLGGDGPPSTGLTQDLMVLVWFPRSTSAGGGRRWVAWRRA